MLDGNNVDIYTNVNAPFPFPDVLQEFSVQTSNYNAEYGERWRRGEHHYARRQQWVSWRALSEYVRNRKFERELLLT